jgi:Polyketide cyclase / dehydrase and lipid transport
MTVHGMPREASIAIHASPEAVYDLVSDLPRMGEWSPENIGGEWQHGGSGKVGDRYISHNWTSARVVGTGAGHRGRARPVLCVRDTPRRRPLRALDLPVLRNNSILIALDANPRSTDNSQGLQPCCRGTSWP